MSQIAYLLWIISRLYTSVIVLNRENTNLKVSWSTDMSPTTSFSLAALPVHPCSQRYGTARWGGGVPGVGYWWVGGWGAIPGTHLQPSQGPIFSHILALSPTYGQMKPFLEVSQIWS